MEAKEAKTVVILAAGLGTRYGSLKQFDPVGPGGEFLLDYSVFDACQAGFSEILFVIRPEMEVSFQEEVLYRYQKRFASLNIDCILQKKDAFVDLAFKHSISEELSHIEEQLLTKLVATRQKPWGTGHALLTAAQKIENPFVMINADDYYGKVGYELLSQALETLPPHRALMVPYLLKNTLSLHGKVSRGVCQQDAQGYLKSIEEMTEIGWQEQNIIGKNQLGKRVKFTGQEPVSLNLWGFHPDFLELLEAQWKLFLKKLLKERLDHPDSWNTQPEFYLPAAVDSLLQEKRLSVKLLPSDDAWFGLTHPQDRRHAIDYLESLHQGGAYPFF